MEIKRIPAGVYAANCYIMCDESTKETAVIDPGGDGEDIIKAVKAIEGKVKYILLTHGHMDHTGAVGMLKEEFSVPVYIHKQDEQLIKNGAYMFGPLKFKGIEVEFDKNVKENDIFELGESEIKCIETPGHTPGGVCYLVNDSLFTGDTLFLRSIGRTDLEGGNFETIIESIKSKLMVLNDDIKVYPGHGPQSTIKYERENNPFF
ncbi:MBL fold metallo-hydrolase [Clostridium omnivorum]|uniref:MBL fold hydrolase n=1 Tax=Clostridium omnivorum TaxID=1604902 RepID=A0ABQ5N0A0_9CLOT|nr:MBL fold metallo-hydrolase [Clostridium sp. E14]GLC28624.1 MBL fold hydrolase [Clostridium sp. E14]